jgi:hypothetical protein
MLRIYPMALRTLAAAGLAVALIGTTQMTAATAGRDFSRCVQACNDARRACGDRCSEDCKALYPTNATQRNACITTCKTICDSQSDECKLVCQAIKDGTCPNEP